MRRTVQICSSHARGTVFVLLLALLLLCGLGAGTSCTAPQQPMLDVTPTSGTLVTGQTTQLAVTRRFPGGPVEVVTERVTYSSSGRNIAKLSDNPNEKGLVVAGAEAGSVIIRILDPFSDAIATVSFTVTSPRIDSIEVAPSPAVVMRPGTSRRFSATAHLNNGVIKDVTNQVIWASSNESAATVGRTQADFGLVTSVGEGDTTISATDSATIAQGRCIVFVRGEAAQLKALVVTPNPVTFGLTQTVQFAALGVFTDGSTKDVTGSVAWTSSREAVATIDAKGLATGLTAGDTTITASGGGDETDAGVSVNLVKGSAAAKIQ